jgi:REP element-mobilizing transposase RayT
LENLDIVGAFKSLSTNEYIHGVNQLNWQSFNKKLWQRNYYEHIIRDEEDYNRIFEYIERNPLKWEIDSFHHDNFDA